MFVRRSLLRGRNCLACSHTRAHTAQLDEKFATEGANFVAFDFNAPERIPLAQLRSFDFIVIDPPFITKEVWQQYADTVKLIQRSDQSKVLLTTIGANDIASLSMHANVCVFECLD